MPVRVIRKSIKYLTFVVLTVVVAAAAYVYFWFSALEQHKASLEKLLSARLDSQVSMDEVSTRWDGVLAVLEAKSLEIGEESQASIREVSFTVNPAYALKGRLKLNRVEIEGASLQAERLADGSFRIAGLGANGGGGFLRRLIDLDSVSIDNSEVVWRDASEPGRTVRLRDLQVQMETLEGEHHFSLGVTLPEDVVKELAVSGRYSPGSTTSEQWSGEFNLNVEHLNLSRIPDVIQEMLPWQSHGYVSTQLSSHWSAAQPVDVVGTVSVSDFVIPYFKDRTPLAAKRFSSGVTWRRDQASWRLLFDTPEILFDTVPISLSWFEIEGREAKRVYRGADIDVTKLLSVVDRMDIEVPGEELLAELEPQGEFSQASLTLEGPFLQTEDWGFEGRFREVGWKATEGHPGVTGLTGQLKLDGKQGTLSVDSTDLALDAPRLLPRSVRFDRVEGAVEWRRWGRDWVLDITDGTVANTFVSLSDFNLYTRLPKTQDESPFVLARSAIEHLDVAEVRELLPFDKMPPKVATWLARALVDGELTRGRAHFNGPLDKFPFRDGTGEFLVSASVKGGILDYAANWPRLEALEGTVSLTNSEFLAQGNPGNAGRIMGSDIREVRVHTEDLFRRDRVIDVEGVLDAEADDVIQFLRKGPLVKNQPPEHSRIAGKGSGELYLNIQLPFTRLKEETQVTGRYDFDGPSVYIQDGVEFEALKGTLEFTRDTVEGEGITGLVMQGPVTVDVSTVSTGLPIRFAVDARGKADAATLEPIVGPGLISRLDGSAEYKARFVGGGEENTLKVSTDLVGVAVGMPAPFRKAPETGAELEVGIRFDANSQNIGIDLNQTFRAELNYLYDGPVLSLENGAFNLGSSLDPPETGVVVGVDHPQFDMDEWIDEIIHQQGIAATDDESGDGIFDQVQTIAIDTDSFVFANRDFESLSVDAERVEGQFWRADMQGVRMGGVGELYLDAEPQRYRFDMDYLYWPAPPELEDAELVVYEPSDPGEYMTLDVSADRFHYDYMKLGRLDLVAGTSGNEWRTSKLSLSQPELQIEGEGVWSEDENGMHRTALTLEARTEDLGAALTQLDFPDQVAHGKATLEGSFNWAGEPRDYSLDRLNGELALVAEDGRFLQLKPGSGKLLGLFNVEALTRRLQFDFTDVYKEGLAFDSISGEMTLDNGDLFTDSVLAMGPATFMDVSGRVGMYKEDYDMEVIVAPQLGGNASLFSAIANPAAGAIVFLFQKVFKKQLAKVLHYKFLVTGSWEDPQIEAQIPNVIPETNDPQFR